MPYSLNLYSDLCQLFLKKKYKWMNVYMILVLGILQINEKPLFLFSGLSNLLPIIYVFLIFFFTLLNQNANLQEPSDILLPFLLPKKCKL